MKPSFLVGNRNRTGGIAPIPDLLVPFVRLSEDDTQ